MRYFALLALLVSLPVASRACMNDRDSDALAIQNERLPDAIRVISGRFERNPPRYFQMRIERVEKELKVSPHQFGLYDDLAVAHDRLGDDVAAMRVMAQKRALLPIYNAKDKANKEAWYRYYANDGTFRAHRFLHEGAKGSRIGEMKQARDEIKRAIEIKPDAHFGRERVQLMVMDWIVARKQKRTGKTLGEWIEARDNWLINYGTGSTETYSQGKLIQAEEGTKGDSPVQVAAKESHRRETAEGLAGLVVLGAAWNSPDVFEALARSLEVEDTIALRYLALLRCRELLESKKPSLGGLTVTSINEALADSEELSMDGIGINEPNKKTLNSLYLQLRQEADQWNESRTNWMEAKFAQGQHPDTEANFWQSFPETAPPSLDVEWFNQRERANQNIRNTILVGSLIVVGVPILLIVLLVVFLRRRAARETSLA